MCIQRRKVSRATRVGRSFRPLLRGCRNQADVVAAVEIGAPEFVMAAKEDAIAVKMGCEVASDTGLINGDLGVVA